MAHPVLESPRRCVGNFELGLARSGRSWESIRFPPRPLGKDVGALISNIGSGAAATASAAPAAAAAAPAAKGGAKEEKKEEKKEKEKPKVEEKEESDDDMGLSKPLHFPTQVF